MNEIKCGISFSLYDYGIRLCSSLVEGGEEQHQPKQ